MNDPLDLDAVMAAAEQAAGAGDYASAAEHLRRAARLQQSALGPAHPDLASTFNNLGVVCERSGRLDDAEEAYRRAYAIARNAFAPDHPSVVTSEQNLREFCTTNGRPFEVAASPAGPAPPHGTTQADASGKPVVAETTRGMHAEGDRAPAAASPMAVVGAKPLRAGAPPTPAAPPAPASSARRAPEPTTPASRPKSHGPVPDKAIVQAASSPEAPPSHAGRRVVLLALVVVVAAVTAFWFFAMRDPGPRDDPGVTPAASTPATSSAPAPDTSAAPMATATAAPTMTGPAPPAETAAPVPATTSAVRDASPPAPPADRAAETSPSTDVALVRANVCRNFSSDVPGGAWRCDPVSGATDPGVLVFLTRIRSPRAATVEHRWYRDDSLVQRVRLRIGANRGAGYRTYSRNTVGPGAWRVELRDGAGTLLHEARFTVR